MIFDSIVYRTSTNVNIWWGWLDRPETAAYLPSEPEGSQSQCCEQRCGVRREVRVRIWVLLQDNHTISWDGCTWGIGVKIAALPLVFSPVGCCTQVMITYRQPNCCWRTSDAIHRWVAASVQTLVFYCLCPTLEVAVCCRPDLGLSIIN